MAFATIYKTLPSGDEVVLGHIIEQHSGFWFNPRMPHRRSSRKIWETPTGCVPRWARGDDTRLELNLPHGDPAPASVSITSAKIRAEESERCRVLSERICGLLRNHGVVIAPGDVALEMSADSSDLSRLIAVLEAGNDTRADSGRPSLERL